MKNQEYMNKTQILANIDEHIIENTSGAITATILNTALHNIVENVSKVNGNELFGTDNISISQYSITYDELVQLRDAAKLIPGMQYRITDYTCTTSTENTQSANHIFDIIVTPIDESHLSEEAKAAHHEGDTYFENNDLNTWKIWYCLDNNQDKFAWAVSKYIIINSVQYTRYSKNDDLTAVHPYCWKSLGGSYRWTNTSTPEVSGVAYKANDQGALSEQIASISTGGKGVIYRMIDEFGNDVAYDFKNILFTLPSYIKLYGENRINYRRTSQSDIMINGVQYYCWGNEYYTTSENPNIHREEEGEGGEEGGEEGEEGSIVIINGDPVYTYDGENLEQIGEVGIFFSLSNAYTFNTKQNNVNADSSINPNFGIKNNVIKSYSTYYCNHLNFNILEGYDICNNIFENDCVFNFIGDYSQFNIFKNRCSLNILNTECSYNIFENNCIANTLESYCKHNVFNNECYEIKLGNNCSFNTFGKNCGNIITGNNFVYNIINSYCQDIITGIDKNILNHYFKYLTIKTGVHCIHITTTATTSLSNMIKNIVIDESVSGTYNNYTTLTITDVNQDFETHFKKNADTIVYV